MVESNEANKVATSYAEANQLYFGRTNWNVMGKRQCGCGNVFYVEVARQTQCRDCHAVNKTGFYAPDVESVASIGVRTGRW